MFTVYHSNHLEHLADQFGVVVCHPLASPPAPEIIIVQSNGMARWLSLHLAQRLGICANIHFPFPASFFWEMFRLGLTHVPETAPFATEILTWRLMESLWMLEDAPRFAPLTSYLGGDDDFRRFDLAYRIADVFDQYLVYRLDWIARWERGGD